MHYLISGYTYFFVVFEKFKQKKIRTPQIRILDAQGIKLYFYNFDFLYFLKLISLICELSLVRD